MIRKAKVFIGEVKSELGKATWPWDPKEKGLKKYRELIDSTGIVLIAMLLMGAFVALNDFFLINAVSAFTRTGLEDRLTTSAPAVVAEPAPIVPVTDPAAPVTSAPSSPSSSDLPESPSPSPSVSPTQAPTQTP